ncbi:MAG TPA: FAD-binding protein, partial [Candidatus Sumerlaeota bacterium]|nr:FAD-binding protein [Candidatus Sumerlaeota bacterium]
RPPNHIPEEDRDYYLERRYPSFGNLVPRDVASRAAKAVCDEGRGVGEAGLSVYLDFRDAIARLGRKAIADKYGNLFDMYLRITDENPYEVPMRIYPAVHYTMGGLWVDYNLMSTIPGLYVLGEANFSDHGANRLGASALMQGLADGYFILPYTIGDYLAGSTFPTATVEDDEFKATRQEVLDQTERMIRNRGNKDPRTFHRELGAIMWDYVGMARNAQGLREAITKIRALREEYWQNLKVPGRPDSFNKYLEYAGRIGDYMELGELVAMDALQREESCGGHFREEYQTEEGEALRNDERFAFAAAWEYKGPNQKPELHREDLTFESVELKQRSYK